MNVIAMDAGQTGIRAQLRVAGEIVKEIEAPGARADRPIVGQLVAVVAQLDPGVEAVLGIGSTGLGADVTGQQILAEVASLGVTRVLLTHDSVSSYLGALGEEPGAVVASGTGVVTLAVGEQEMARIDGWGYMLGDAGSGYWIGRAGLDAVLREHDGRGPATALTPIVRDDFADLEGMYIQVQQDPARVSRVAAYARMVAELASDDQVCRAICERAAAELVASVVTGLERVGQDRRDPAVSTLGKVFQGRVVAQTFEKLLRERFNEARVLEPAGTSLDGAAALARLGEDSPLWSKVSVGRW